MTCNLVAVFQHGPYGFGVALQRHGHPEHGDPDVPLAEDTQQAPETRTAAVLIQGFHALVAHSGVSLCADNLR